MFPVKLTSQNEIALESARHPTSLQSELNTTGPQFNPDSSLHLFNSFDHSHTNQQELMSYRSRVDTYRDGNYAADSHQQQLDESCVSNVSKLSRLQQMAHQPSNLLERMVMMKGAKP